MKTAQSCPSRRWVTFAIIVWMTPGRTAIMLRITLELLNLAH